MLVLVALFVALETTVLLFWGINWTSLGQITTETQTATFVDPEAAQHSHRFYQARQLPPGP